VKPGIQIDFHGHDLRLLPERAMLWQARRMLILADLHLGKSATFRARGLPVPAGTTARDLTRLSDLVRSFDPHALLIVGDLFHAHESEASIDLLRTWRDQHSGLDVAIVPGNHDQHVDPAAIALAVRVCDRLHVEEGMCFSHAPLDALTMPTICGHIHPAVRLTDFDGSGVNVPCFVVDPMQITLPSFGSFTGSSRVAPAPDRQCYAVAAGRVTRVG
jgi:DNA ligase-associated metallophosphoesterase